MRTGKFINQLNGICRYKAFIPNSLPFEIKMDDALQDLLSKADMSLGKLDGIAETVPDVDFFIFMYIRKEATLSSQIEGTQATFSDLLKAEAKIKDHEIHSDVDEIVNYISAMNHGLKRLESFPLSLRLIREIHQLLLRDVRGAGRMPGEFRTSQNWIGGPTIQTASFVPPPAHALPELLSNLEKFMHDPSPMPVLIKTGLIHAQFEGIHPFLDGNGRIGRLLITFYLCQQGILHKPLLYLSEFFKQHRRNYYDRLNAFHGKDDVEGWLKYFLTGLSVMAESAVKKAQKIAKLRQINTDKVMGLGRSAEKGLLLLNKLYRIPMVTVKNIEKIVGIKNPNALVLLSKFLDLKILKETTGQKRNRVFLYQDYVNLFKES
ncbi:MAG: Fic family protein [Candidatus Peregrinibacteria bacterium]